MHLTIIIFGMVVTQGLDLYTWTTHPWYTSFFILWGLLSNVGLDKPAQIIVAKKS